MTIKTHSQWLLLGLLADSSNKSAFELVASNRVRMLLPSLTTSGFRSLIIHLQAKGLLQFEQVSQQAQLYLTELGKTTLYSLFPALDPLRQQWAGNWSCLVFQSAPDSDRQFRYLRRVLVGLSALALTRGVYLYPGPFPKTFINLCHKLYPTAISIFSIGSLQFGAFRPIVIEKGELKSLQEIYSGISREISTLLDTIDNLTPLTDQQKQQFVSLFDRFTAVLRTDNGLGAYYFPEETWGREILQQLRAIILL